MLNTFDMSTKVDYNIYTLYFFDSIIRCQTLRGINNGSVLLNRAHPIKYPQVHVVGAVLS